MRSVLNEMVCRPFEENQMGLAAQLNGKISVPLHIRPQTITFHWKKLQCYLHSVKHIFDLKQLRERYAHLSMGRALIYIEIQICNRTTVCKTFQNIICDHHWNPNHPTVQSRQYNIIKNDFTSILRNTRTNSNNQLPSLGLTNDLWITHFKIE